jgi:dTDP-4-amino-4,6-dideoxygalactose transaminase
MEGVCSRMDGLQAAILSAKLPHLADWTCARQQKAARYNELLAGLPYIITPKLRARVAHVFHVYCIRAPRRDALQNFLKEHGIDTTRHYPTPLPFLKAYARLGHTPADFPVAARHSSEILSLPIYPEMSDEQQSHVAATIREFIGG